MKRLLLLGALLVTTPAKAGVLPINQFGGLNTDNASITLQEGQTPDSENVLTDVGPGLTGREGFVRKSTSSFTAGWQFPKSNGTRYLIIRSSGTLKASLDNGQTFTVSVGTVAAGVKTAGASLGDRFYYVNQTDGLKYWDGTVGTPAVTVDATMLADKMAVFKGRLAIAGRTSNLRALYLSKYLDGTSFTAPTNPSDDDAAIITVSGSLDENIQGIYSTFRDKLMVFKTSSFAGLYGSRRSNFSLRTFSDTVGLSSAETIQDCDGKLRWLGANRTVWEFDDSTLTPISLGNDDLFGSVIQGDSASRAFSLTTAADWGGGTFTGNGLSTSTIPGDLAFLPWYTLDNWDDGNLLNPVWTADVGTGWGPTGTALRNAPITSPNEIIQTTASASSGAWAISTRLTTDGTCADFIAFYPMIAGGYNSALKTFNASYAVFFSNINPGVSADISITVNGTSFPVTIAGPITVAIGAGYNTIVFRRTTAGLLSALINGTQVLSATDVSVTSSTLSGIVTSGGCGGGTDPVFDFDNFLYSSDEGAPGTALISTTALYTSGLITVGTAISAWTPITITEVSTTAAVTYQFGSTTTASVAAITNWQSVSNGTLPTISTNPYAAMRATFNADAATDTARVADFSIGWGEGSNITAASAYSNQRYWLAVAISSTANNKVLVYDRNNQWQRFSGINADTMVMFSSNLLFANTNGLFQAEDGYTDNGSPIVSYYRSKTIAPAGIDIFSKYRKLWLTTDNSDSSIATYFRLDEWDETSMASVSMNGTLGLQTIKLPFSVSGPQQSRFIDFKWAVTGSSFWRLLNANLYFDPDAVAE